MSQWNLKIKDTLGLLSLSEKKHHRNNGRVVPFSESFIRGSTVVRTSFFFQSWLSGPPSMHGKFVYQC